MSATTNGRMSRHGSYLGSPGRAYNEARPQHLPELLAPGGHPGGRVAGALQAQLPGDASAQAVLQRDVRGAHAENYSKQATAAAVMMAQWWDAFTGCPHCNVVQDSVIPCSLHEAALIYP